MDIPISYPTKSHKRDKIDKKYISRKSKPKKEYKSKPPKEKYKQSSSNKPKRNKYRSKKNIKCYKCGRPGHYSNRCKMKQNINNLEIEDDLKSKLLKLLINSISSESKSEPEVSSSDELNELEEFSSSSEEDENKDSCLCSTSTNPLKAIEKVNHLNINVLIDDQKNILGLIDQILIKN